MNLKNFKAMVVNEVKNNKFSREILIREDKVLG